MFCPTKDDTLAALLAMLPRGRAWQSNVGGPEPYRVAPFDPQVFDPLAFDTDSRVGSVLYRFWEAVASVINYANERLCDLVLEMFCATHKETHGQWLIEYGLPDDCDPFPDLCDKVAALGSARCEYFNERIARLGWTVTCDGLVLTVQTSDVEDDVGTVTHLRHVPMAGRMRAGWRPSCDLDDPSVQAARCVLERIAPAHMKIIYA